MTCLVHQLLVEVHLVKTALDEARPGRQPRAIPMSVMRHVRWHGVTLHAWPRDSEGPPANTEPPPYPWLTLEAMLIERRLAAHAPTKADYENWMRPHTLCPHPITGDLTPVRELLAHHADVAYRNAAMCYHHNQTTRRWWTGRGTLTPAPQKQASGRTAATPPPALGLPLDQGLMDARGLHAGFHLRVDHLLYRRDLRPILFSPVAFPQRGEPVSTASMLAELRALPREHRNNARRSNVYRMAMGLIKGFETEPTPTGGPPRAKRRLMEAPAPSTPHDTYYGDHAQLFAALPNANRMSPIEEMLISAPARNPGAHIEHMLKGHCNTASSARRKRPHKRRRRHAHAAVATGNGGTTAMMTSITVANKGQAVRTGTCMLDTGADICIFRRDHSTPHTATREERANLPDVVVTLGGGVENLGELRSMTIARPHAPPITILGYAETKRTRLDHGQIALIGMGAILRAQFDLNAIARAQLEPTPQPAAFLPLRAAAKAATAANSKPTRSGPPRAFDVCCGIGGATLGMSNAGWKVVGMIDIDPHCVQVCRRAFPGTPVYEGDVTTPAFRATLRASGAQAVFTSFPCQPHSSLNRRKSRTDPRTDVATQALRHIAAVRPALVIMENVPPWARTPSYHTACSILRNAGYDVQSTVLNAAKLGVPQSRRRLITTAFLGRGDAGLAAFARSTDRRPDAVIRDVLPELKHVYFPTRINPRQPYVIPTSRKLPCLTTKCMSKPPARPRPCRHNSAPLEEATVLSAHQFARLQALPPTHPLPYDQPSLVGRLIGNAVPPPMAAAIAGQWTPSLTAYMNRPKGPRALNIPQDAANNACRTAIAAWDRALQSVVDRETVRVGHCNLAEKVLRKYLDKHGDKATQFLRKEYRLSDIDINPKLPPAVQAKIRAICKQHSAAFLADNQSLPPPVLNPDGSEFIYTIKFKEGAKPTRCRSPKYPAGSAARTILEAWTESSLRSGLITPAPQSAWASRVLTCAKYNLDDTRAGIPDDLRIVSDFVQANAQKERITPVYGHVHLELHRAAGHKFYFQADAASSYWSFKLDRQSSESTAVWLPYRGQTLLFRFTRMVMGDTNASTVMYTRYAQCMADDLSTRARELLSQLADDFVGFGNTTDELLFALTAFLKMCVKNQITIKPPKFRVGYESVTYFGFLLNAEGQQPTERNLDPIRQMVAPTCRKELQAILGLFNFFSHFISDEVSTNAGDLTTTRKVHYAELVAPLQSLLRGKDQGTAAFKALWGQPQQHALERVRGILLAGTGLHAPDYSKPLRLNTDASDYGWGANLYQLSDPDPSGERRTLIIRMWSRAWTEAQRKLPVYFREALGWCLGVKKARPYALTSKFPLITLTDHLPLTWVRKASGKAMVSAFLCDSISDVDWTIDYIPGHKNTLADPLSRPPFLGPLRPSIKGLTTMVQALLKHLPPTLKACARPWATAGKDTRHVARTVQQWRTPTNPVLTAAPSQNNIAQTNYDLAVVVPTAERAGTVCRHLLARGLPMACLIPSSLLHRVPQRLDGSYDKTIVSRVATAGKIVFAQGEYMWLVRHAHVDGFGTGVHRVYRAAGRKRPDRPRTATVRAGKRRRMGTQLDPADTDPQTTPTSDLPGVLSVADTVGTAAMWATELTSSDRALPKGTKGRVLTDANTGLCVYREKDELDRIIVPANRRHALIDLTHKQMHHLGWAKNYAHLRAYYYWPTMRRDIEQRVAACVPCKLAKGRRLAAHKHWRASPTTSPRTAWGFDFKGMTESADGSREIGCAVDMATHKVILMALPSRQAPVVAQALLDNLICKEGVPRVFHSDAAAELMGRVMHELWALLGTRATSTMAHHPTGNALCERVWRFVNAALRCLSDAQYGEWHRYISSIEAAWNSKVTTSLGVTPFEASCGMHMRTAARSAAAPPPRAGQSMSKSDIARVCQMATTFRLMAADNDRWSREREAKLKNERGAFKLSFKPGDLVKIFIPPTAAEAERRHRKVKHCMWYRGPAKVVTRHSPTTYTVEMVATGRRYERSIINITPWGLHDDTAGNAPSGPGPAPARPPTAHAAPAHTGVYRTGDIIAVRDNPSQSEYWIAKVTRVRGDTLDVWYYGTTGHTLRTAVFRPLYIGAGTDGHSLSFQSTTRDGTQRWRGTLPAAGLPACVLARQLRLTSRGRLTDASYQVIRSLVRALSHARADRL